MARIHLTPQLPSYLEFEDVSLSITRKSRRSGGGKRQRMRRFAGEFAHESEALLHDITFTVAPGESLAVIGDADSGREELLRLAAGTMIADSGTVRRRDVLVPMVKVSGALDRSYTYRQNIYIIGGLLGMTPAQVEDRVDSIAAEAEVGNRLDKYLGDARPIVRQKLAWSICMAVDAPAYAVDQIIVVGDESYRQHCWERVEAKRASGVTFLLSSDEPDFLARFCDRAIVLDGGTIAKQTSVEEGLEMLARMTPVQPRRKAAKSEEDDDSEYEEF